MAIYVELTTTIQVVELSVDQCYLRVTKICVAASTCVVLVVVLACMHDMQLHQRACSRLIRVGARSALHVHSGLPEWRHAT